VASRTTLFDVADYEAAAPHANYDVTPLKAAELQGLPDTYPFGL